MKTFRITACAAVLALMALTAACSDDESTSANTTTTANRGFEVNTPEGQVSLSLSGQLPPNWPSDFPVPSGAEPAGSGSLGGSDSTGFVGVYTSSDSPEDTYTFYKDSAGLSVTSSSSVGSGSAFIGNVGFEGNPSGNVTVIPGGDASLIIVFLSESSSGTTVAGSGTTVAP